MSCERSCWAEPGTVEEPTQCSHCEGPVRTTRLYRVIWIVEHNGRETKRGVHCPGPSTHEEACTVLTKMAPRAERRDLLEELP